jgi:oligoribonuclease
MIYVSIDIETTGLDNDNSQVLSIGLVVEDTNNLKPFDELPKLEVAIIRERLEGEIFALNMNRELISDILSYKIAKTPEAKAEIVERTGREYLYEEDVTKRIFHFLYDHKALDGGPDTFNPLYQNRVVEVVNGKTYPALTSKMKPYYFNGAGKNFANFDNKFLERLPRWKQVLKARGRTIDPSILFVDWKNDEAIPGLSLCKGRAHLDPHVTHNAIDDAMDIVKLLRTQYA